MITVSVHRANLKHWRHLTHFPINCQDRVMHAIDAHRAECQCVGRCTVVAVSGIRREYNSLLAKNAVAVSGLAEGMDEDVEGRLHCR